MAEQVETRVGADIVGDYDAICRVVQLYIDGASRGDVTKLEEAFHPDSRMFGALGGTRYDIPISTFFEMAQGMPADTGSYRGRIVAVHQLETLAGILQAYLGRLRRLPQLSAVRNAEVKRSHFDRRRHPQLSALR